MALWQEECQRAIVGINFIPEQVSGYIGTVCTLLIRVDKLSSYTCKTADVWCTLVGTTCDTVDQLLLMRRFRTRHALPIFTTGFSAFQTVCLITQRSLWVIIITLCHVIGRMAVGGLSTVCGPMGDSRPKGKVRQHDRTTQSDIRECVSQLLWWRSLAETHWSRSV